MEGWRLAGKGDRRRDYCGKVRRGDPCDATRALRPLVRESGHVNKGDPRPPWAPPEPQAAMFPVVDVKAETAMHLDGHALRSNSAHF